MRIHKSVRQCFEQRLKLKEDWRENLYGKFKQTRLARDKLLKHPKQNGIRKWIYKRVKDFNQKICKKKGFDSSGIYKKEDWMD